jgi:hypothetical protein
MVYMLIFIALILIGFYIYVELLDKPVLAFASKGLASFGFIALFGFSVIDTDAYQVSPLIVGMFGLGLVAGLMGDLYLALRPMRPVSENHLIILFGTLCFAMGHGFYYSALLIYGSFTLWALVISAIITVVTFIGSKFLKLDWGPSKYPSLIYSFLVFLVAGQALLNAIETGFNPFSTIVFIGALLFGISDLILAQIYFGKSAHDKKMIVLNLSTYYVAQVLLAFSLFLL